MRALGRSFGDDAVAGDRFLLEGPFGAGKPTFVQGLALGLGVALPVSSPSFVIETQYRGRLTLYHVDLYRLEGPEVDDLGLEDLVCGDGIVAIEWAERWRGRPNDATEVSLADVGDERRRLTIRPGSSALPS
jgi:tRNA threonylcarbamoyladenosine biosynthesis protein TsaE